MRNGVTKTLDLIKSVFIVFLILRQNFVLCVEVKIEAETMLGNNEDIFSRRLASEGKSVHLISDQSIFMDICLLTPTEISSVEVIYSNDGGSDRIQVSVGKTVLGVVDTLAYTDNGQGWSRFRTSSETFPPVTIEGRQSLHLYVLQSDKYGVEIDYIKFNLNKTLSLDSLECAAFCFDDISYSPPPNETNCVSPGRAEQKSVKTLCAEEDNVNVPIFHDNPSKFVVTASMPKYRSFSNSRGPDWENCAFSSAFWSFQHIQLANTLTLNSDKAQLVMSMSPSELLGTNRIAMIEVDFVLADVRSGSTESVVGTLTTFNDLIFTGSLTLQFQYYDRYNKWSTTQIKTVKQGTRSVEFSTPDNSFREGGGNKIRVEIFTDRTSIKDAIIIGELSMRMRQLVDDKSRTIFQDGTTVIEGVDMDLWWRVNETMTVTVANKTFDNIDYIRIYQRVPWTASLVSQVFVLYQDGNVRLLPITPHGLDWIPFGSSVIIGQTDPLSPRPSAPINHLDIDPDNLKVTVWYADGGVIPIEIDTSVSETRLTVSETHFTGDLQTQPFFTFRSMYVTDGNGDVDHMSVDGGNSISILDDWSSLPGNFFAFFRKCISKHNTQSPDITISVFP
ncbi:hypothetical protein ACF0H5_008946 [Mactra antiquata]